MATEISVKIGPLTGKVTYQNDVKTEQVLRYYYAYMGLGPVDAAPQAMLDAIAASIAREISRYAVQQYIDERRVVLEQQLEDEAEAAADLVGSIT